MSEDQNLLNALTVMDYIKHHTGCSRIRLESSGLLGNSIIVYVDWRHGDREWNYNQMFSQAALEQSRIQNAVNEFIDECNKRRYAFLEDF